MSHTIVINSHYAVSKYEYKTAKITTMALIINNLKFYSPQDHRRSGVYTVGNMNFVNKADALIYATSTNQDVSWDFNPDVFGAIDWTIPIETSLSELYRQRAQQLREQYDYLSLFYSGGVDSTNVLQTFISNNIFLDEIVMYRPSRIANEANIQDTHPKNWFSEIPFAAIPYLQKYMTNSRTKIRVIDIDTAIEQFFQDPNLSTYFANIPDYSAQQIGKISINVTDKDWQDLYLKDVKICHILGKEKPRIFYNNGKYGCDFYDDSVKTAFYANEMFSANYSHVVKNQIFEPFYWTADLPEIVIKQCQMVKESAQENIESFQRFFPNLSKNNRAKDIEIMKIIYPDNVLEVRSLFTAGKSHRGLMAHNEEWFYRTMGNNVIGQFKDIISFSNSNISDKFFKKYIMLPAPEVLPKIGYEYYHSKMYYF